MAERDFSREPSPAPDLRTALRRAGERLDARGRGPPPVDDSDDADVRCGCHQREGVRPANAMWYAKVASIKMSTPASAMTLQKALWISLPRQNEGVNICNSKQAQRNVNPQVLCGCASVAIVKVQMTICALQVLP